MIDNLTIFQSLLAFLIILTPIVFIHELGHFIFARLFGVEVEKFSIGFGPVIFFFHDKRLLITSYFCKNTDFYFLSDYFENS